MTLWYMWSEVLGGFYKSEVYAAGKDRDDAIQVALQAYDAFVADSLGYHPITHLYVDDPDFDKAANKKRKEFHWELKLKFRQTTRRAKIDISS